MDNPTDTPQEDTVADEPTNTETDQGQPPAHPATFEPITSQDQLNALLGDRLARERAKFADYSDLKTKAARLDDIEAANKSELQKATDKATQAEQRATQAQERLNATLTRSAAIEAAVAAGTIDADVVATLIQSRITIDDNGEPQGAKQAVAALLKEKPHLFNTIPSGARDAAGGGSAANQSSATMDDWIRGR